MSATTMIDQVIPSVIKDAAERGTDFATVYRVVFRAMVEAYPDPQAQFTAAGFAGRKALMQREGGCVDAKTAATLYAGAHSQSAAVPETVRKAAREQRLVSVRDGLGGMLFPAWQFRKDEGGTLPGLPLILKELSLRPGFSEITPFIFFLQPHPRLGTSPLKALRQGSVNEVVEAAKEYQF